MPEVSSFKPGEFCWFELATSDQDSAKNFYSKLFNWEINDQEMGPGMYYTQLEKNGKPVAALYGMEKERLAAGIPPHWNTYIAVDDVDAATKNAAKLGANVLAEPFDVMEFGRMSTVQDPTGAGIQLWQGKSHKGAAIVDEPNAFCWYELNTNDTEKAKEFYSTLLGWDVGGSPEYTEWKKDGRSIGGMMKIQPEWGPVPPAWTSYVMVDNADASVEKAKGLGGSVVMGPADVPGTGRFALLQDPQGATFAVFEPLKK
jgi:predicted enzyme related to lactoylglutathione lyase